MIREERGHSTTLFEQQADELHAILPVQPSSGPRLDLAYVLYCMSGMLAIGALTLCMNLGRELFGGWGIVPLCLVYAAIGGIFRRL